MQTKTSWSSLSLTAKGVILLSIPLCLQLGLGVVLIKLQQQAENEAKQAIEARTLATQINTIMSDILHLVALTQPNTQAHWQKEGYKGLLAPKYRLLLRQIEDKYALLEKETETKPSLNLVVKQSHKPFRDAVEIIDNANKEILAGNLANVVATSGEKSARLEALAGDFISQELLLLGKNEEEFADKSNLKQAEIRQTTVKYTFFVILASVVFSIFLARFLVHTMIARLRTMAENAVHLARQEPLHEPLAGEDEIAQLDHTFHNMAKKIEEEAQVKQDVYNMVTHDLRTPLTAIQGSLEILDLGQTEPLKERTKKLIKIAVRNSTRAMGLVNDLLDSQKLEAGMIEFEANDVALEEIFENVNLDIAGWIEEYGIKIVFAETDLNLRANHNMLSRVLVNLISNAIKYSPRGGTIVVDVQRASSMAEITVSDQGKGIAKHMQKTVFERFRQVSDGEAYAARSSGLGLSICHDFVALHGGKIWVTSELGQGSTFHFTIPLA